MLSCVRQGYGAFTSHQQKSKGKETDSDLDFAVSKLQVIVVSLFLLCGEMHARLYLA